MRVPLGHNVVPCVVFFRPYNDWYEPVSRLHVAECAGVSNLGFQSVANVAAASEVKRALGELHSGNSHNNYSSIAEKTICRLYLSEMWINASDVAMAKDDPGTTFHFILTIGSEGANAEIA